MYHFQTIGCVLLLLVAQASLGHGQEDDFASTGRKAPSNGCDRSAYSLNCLKLDAVQFLDTMTSRQEYPIVGGLSLVRDPTANQTQNIEIIAEMARSYPTDSQSRLNGYVLAKITNFLQSHTLNVKLLDGSDVAEARSAMETGRKKDKKGGQSIIAAALLMKSMLLALALGALALLAGKALVAALMALLLSALSAFKALTPEKKSTTYEIITKPAHYTSQHTHSNVVHDDHSGVGMGTSGYGRSMNFVLPQHLTKENY